MATASEQTQPESETVEQEATTQEQAHEEARLETGTVRSEKNIRSRAASVVSGATGWGKNMNPAQRAALEEIAQAAGLSSALNQIICLAGSPYITLQGHLIYAQSRGFDGFDEGRLPKEEYEDWGVPATALYAWKCAAIRNGKPFINEVGWSGPSRDGNQPVAKSFPAEMARKRARARALALAFPTGLPSVEEVMRGEEIPDDLYNRAVENYDPIANQQYIKKRVEEFGGTLADYRVVAEEKYPGKRYDSHLTSVAKEIMETLKSRMETMQSTASEPGLDGLA